MNGLHKNERTLLFLPCSSRIRSYDPFHFSEAWFQMLPHLQICEYDQFLRKKMLLSLIKLNLFFCQLYMEGFKYVTIFLQSLYFFFT